MSVETWVVTGSRVRTINGVPSTLQGGTTATVHFYQRSLSGGLPVVATRSYAATNGVYTFPNAVVRLAEVEPDFSKYGVTVSTSAVRYSSSVPAFEEGDPLVYQAIVDSVQSKSLARYVRSVFSLKPHTADWEGMTEDILSQKDFVDTSLLLTACELAMLNADISSWRNLANTCKALIAKGPEFLASIKGFRSWGKVLAKAQLGVDYGVLPTVRDGGALLSGLHTLYKRSREPWRKHSRRSAEEKGLLDTPITSVDVLTVECDALPADFPGVSMTAIELLRNWGMYPSVEMLWDVVPFSFCVDWFLDVGEWAADADTVIREMYFPVRYCIQSTKRTWCPPPGRLWPYPGLSGSVEFSFYDRWLTDTLPVPDLQLDAGSGPLQHWAEAGALVVAKRR